VRIDGELYWDGGIMSNTPTEVIFDDNPRRGVEAGAVEPRLTVGAAHVRTSTMRYFDSREQPINLDHILASGAASCSA
jgi:NTE family protein